MYIKNLPKKTKYKREKTGNVKGCLFFASVIALFMIASLCGCANKGNNTPPKEYTKPEGTEIIVTDYDSYDSADTAVLLKKNTQSGTLTFLNLTLGKTYTLYYDGTTRMFNKYGEGMSLDQIQTGTLVDVLFYKPRKRLTEMQVAKSAFYLSDIERYSIDSIKKEVSLGDDVYKMSDCMKILSEDNELELMDINDADILDFWGIDNTIYSMTVKKGHGYLRLVNDENFIDGFIEIGQSRIFQIKKDLLMTVPEGNYQVAISLNGSSGLKQVSIHRNKETTLDIGDIEVAAPLMGTVIFSLTPSDANIFIDGEEADVSAPVNLEYGLHQLIVKKEGYSSITQYLRVGQASAGVDIVLEALSTDSDEKDENESEEQDSEAITETDVSSDHYSVYIDTPEGAEVYLDGNLIGISPCSFKKEAGPHVLVFRKSGYETRSYTIQVDEENRDITYSFAALVPLGITASSNSGTASE